MHVLKECVCGGFMGVCATYQLTFISLFLIFPSIGNLKTQKTSTTMNNRIYSLFQKNALHTTLQPDRYPVFILVQSIQSSLFIHPELHIIELLAFGYDLDLVMKRHAVSLGALLISKCRNNKSKCERLGNITHQLRQQFRPAHQTEMLHGVKCYTVPGHQPTCLCR